MLTKQPCKILAPIATRLRSKPLQNGDAYSVEAGQMRLIAAAFDDEVAAEAARAGLVRAYGHESIGLSVAPLGRASDPSGPAAILAGRFDEGVVEAVTADVEDLGGRVVVDIDEARAKA